MNPRRLYRSRHDRKIAGVAAGMAEYFEVDPTAMRVAWVITALFGGLTILLYVILAFVIPAEPLTEEELAGGPVHAATAPRAPREPGRTGLVVGIVFVVFGAIALAQSVVPAWFAGLDLGAAFILALGVALVIGASGRPQATAPAGGLPNPGTGIEPVTDR